MINYVAKEDFPKFHEERSAEGRDFSVYPPSSRNFMLPIRFVEPEDMNDAAVGLDLANETNRRARVYAYQLADDLRAKTSVLSKPMMKLSSSSISPPTT